MPCVVIHTYYCNVRPCIYYNSVRIALLEMVVKYSIIIDESFATCCSIVYSCGNRNTHTHTHLHLHTHTYIYIYISITFSINVFNDNKLRLLKTKFCTISDYNRDNWTLEFVKFRWLPVWFEQSTMPITWYNSMLQYCWYFWSINNLNDSLK